MLLKIIQRIRYHLQWLLRHPFLQFLPSGSIKNTYTKTATTPPTKVHMTIAIMMLLTCWTKKNMINLHHINDQKHLEMSFELRSVEMSSLKLLLD